LQRLRNLVARTPGRRWNAYATSRFIGTSPTCHGSLSLGRRSRTKLKYGRWEVRARLAADPGASGNPYHSVLITWPESDEWPAGAEYDFLDVNVGDPGAGAFRHYPNHQPRVQEYAEKAGVDLTEWHNYGFEWTTDGLIGYIDGTEWFRVQLRLHPVRAGPDAPDRPVGQLLRRRRAAEGIFDVDWARIYSAP
jgi:hypothetical protein